MKKSCSFICAALAISALAMVARAADLTTGLYNDWVGDDYTAGSGWVDRVSGVTAQLDGYPYPPVSVSGMFGSHSGVQRDPANLSSGYDGGFYIISPNPPDGLTNYTVSAVIYPTAAGPVTAQNSFQSLMNLKLSPQQLMALTTAFSDFQQQVYQLAEKGDPAAIQAIKEIRKNNQK